MGTVEGVVWKELDKIGGLWKIRGDKKMAEALAGIINIMKELRVLASEHGLEGQLFEGGCLEKVMNLIGSQNHKKFRTQNMDSMSKSQEWESLLKFLSTELSVRERLNLDRKTLDLFAKKKTLIKMTGEIGKTIPMCPLIIQVVLVT